MNNCTAKNHTSEPWSVHYDETSGEWPMVMAAGKIVANVNPSSFCRPAHGFVEMPSLDNAQRIVACVNACAGIPTDILESSAANMLELSAARANCAKWGSEAVKASQQRDELLAVLEDIIAYNVQYATDKYGDASKAETFSCVQRSRAAIAKAKGGAA